MPPDDLAAAAAPLLLPAPAAAPEPEPEPKWTRKDDKLLQQLLFYRNAICIHAGRTPAQVWERYGFMVDEMTSLLEAQQVQTPCEWDKQTAATTMAVPSLPPPRAAAAAGEREVALPVAAEDDSASPAVAPGGDRSGKGPRRKKRRPKKPPTMWTEDEHRAYLAGLDNYEGDWKAMSRECLPNKTPSQIASHHQKYRNRQKQRQRNECKRASIHDITEPAGRAAAAAVAVAGEDEPPGADASAPGPGQEDEPQNPVESGEPPAREDGLFGPAEDEPGTLLT